MNIPTLNEYKKNAILYSFIKYFAQNFLDPNEIDEIEIAKILSDEVGLLSSETEVISQIIDQVTEDLNDTR